MVGKIFAVVQTFFAVTPAAVYPWRDSSRGGSTALCWDDRRSPRSRRGSSSRSARCSRCQPRSSRRSLALFERVFQYLDLEHDIVDAPDAVTLPRDEGRPDRLPRRVVSTSCGFRRRWSRQPPRPRRRTERTASDLVTVCFKLLGSDARGRQPRDRAGQLAAVVGPSGAARRPWPTSYRALRRRPGGDRVDGHDVLVAMALVPRGSDRDGDAGDVPLPRERAAEPALRAPRRVRAGARGCGPGSPHPRAGSSSSTTATTRSSASAATGCSAARSSGRDRARAPTTRGSSSWTRHRPDGRPASASSKTRSSRSWRGGRRSRSRTGSRRSCGRT